MSPYKQSSKDINYSKRCKPCERRKRARIRAAKMKKIRSSIPTKMLPWIAAGCFLMQMPLGFAITNKNFLFMGCGLACACLFAFAFLSVSYNDPHKTDVRGHLCVAWLIIPSFLFSLIAISLAAWGVA